MKRLLSQAMKWAKGIQPVGHMPRSQGCVANPTFRHVPTPPTNAVRLASRQRDQLAPCGSRALSGQRHDERIPNELTRLWIKTADAMKERGLPLLVTVTLA